MKFDVVVAIAALAPGAAAAGTPVVSELLQTVNGSPRDYSKDERTDAVEELLRLAGDAKADARVRDDAARAVASLLGGDFDAVVLHGLERARSSSLTRELRGALDRLALNDDKGRAEQLCQLLGATLDPAVVPSIQRVIDDGATKEMRVAGLRALGRLSPGFGNKGTAATDAATVALVGYVDHKALGKTAREVLLRMHTRAAPLRPLLKHADPDVRAFATRALEGSLDGAADDAGGDLVDALVRQLREAKGDDDRARALRALGRAFCGDGSGVCDNKANAVRLIDLAGPVLLEKKDTQAAQAAITALERVREPALVKILIVVLDHPRSHVREKAAVLLGRIGDRSAKPALVQRLDTVRLDGNWQELDALMHALTALGVVEADAPFFAAFLGRKDICNTSFAWNHKDMWTQLARLPPSSSKAFIPLLRNEGRDTRKSIALLLGQLGDPDSAVALLDVIERNDEIKEDAAEALAGCADLHALPRMQKILEQKLAKESWNGGGALAISFVRADRAFGLERTLSLIGKQGVLGIELLRALLKETHPSDARAFAHAFAQKNPDQSTTYTYRWLAILGWAQIDTAQSIDTLCSIATTHDDEGVRTLAATSLRRFPEARAVACMVTALAKIDDEGRRKDVVRALIEATGQELGDDVKAWQVFVSGGVGLRGGEAALVAALSHPSPPVRSLSAHQLGTAKQGLAALLRHLPDERDEAVRTEVLQAIAAFDSDVAKGPLVAELERNRASWPERVALAKALDRLGDGRGTLALLKLVDGSDGAVAQRAMLALSEVTGEPPTSSPPFWRAWWKTHAERYRMPDR